MPRAFIRCALIALFGLGLIARPVVHASQINIQIISLNPAANARSAASEAAIQATANATINGATVSAATYRVQGEQTGRYPGVFSSVGASFSLDPSARFKPGERVRVSATAGIKSPAGDSLTPRVWEFTAATGGGTGDFGSPALFTSFGERSGYDLALGDLDGDGDLDAMVVDRYDRPTTVWLNNGTGTFSPHPTTPAFGAGNSYSVALGDLDGDGDLDAVIANGQDSQSETVWLNDGSGSFSAHPTAPSFGAGDSWSIDLGDLDGDGDLDVVVTNYGEPETVWLNDGSGSFSAHPTAPSFGAGDSYGLALGDLDSDGDLDAVVANGSLQPETVWLNNGLGAFSPHPSVPAFGGSSSSTAVHLGDLDGDGDLDAVVSNANANSVWLNNGAGALTPHPTTPFFQPANGGFTGFDTALGDVDSDGDLDAITTGKYTWLNNGAGAFTPNPVKASFGGTFTNAIAIRLGDVDTDGDLDAVLSNSIGPTEVHFNPDRPQFTSISPAANHPGAARDATISASSDVMLVVPSVTSATLRVQGEQTGLYPGELIDVTSVYSNGFSFDPAARFKPGERIRVTTTSGIKSIWGNNFAPRVWEFTAATGGGGGVFSPHPTRPALSSGTSPGVGLGDLDGDGDLDAVAASTSNLPETVWLNDGTGALSPHPTAPSFGAGNTWSVGLGDLDGDGDLDALVNNATQGLAVWLNNGAGVFSPHATIPTFGGSFAMSVSLALGDLDGDGDLDVVVPYVADQPEQVWLNDGSGGFLPHPTTPSFGAGNSWRLALGDLDTDGDLDAVVANDTLSTVWLNDGRGSFSPHPTLPTLNAGLSLGIALGDLDSDGDLDALFGNDGASTVWLNDGAGALTRHPTSLASPYDHTFDARLGDLDGDGDLDALLANRDEGRQTVWLNDGSAGFRPHPATPSFAGGNSFALDMGDLDADGDLDAIVANGDNQGLSVWLNGAAPAGVVVLPTTGLVTTEAGGTAAFSVTLTSQPTATVTLALSSGDLSEGAVLSSTLSFNESNWNVPHVVTIQGVDDQLDDGDIVYAIGIAPASSADPRYQGIDPADVAAINMDDDSAAPRRLYLSLVLRSPASPSQR